MMKCGRRGLGSRWKQGPQSPVPCASCCGHSQALLMGLERRTPCWPASEVRVTVSRSCAHHPAAHPAWPAAPMGLEWVRGLRLPIPGLGPHGADYLCWHLGTPQGCTDSPLRTPTACLGLSLAHAWSVVLLAGLRGSAFVLHSFPFWEHR